MWKHLLILKSNACECDRNIFHYDYKDDDDGWCENGTSCGNDGKGTPAVGVLVCDQDHPNHHCEIKTIDNHHSKCSMNIIIIDQPPIMCPGALAPLWANQDFTLYFCYKTLKWHIFARFGLTEDQDISSPSSISTKTSIIIVIDQNKRLIIIARPTQSHHNS